MEEDGSREPSAGDGVAVAGIAVFAVACCAALPVLAALAGGVAIGTVLGVGAGVLAAIGLVALVVLRTRRAR